MKNEKSGLRAIVWELADKAAERDYAECLLQLPEWRRRKAESYRQLPDRLQCAKAYVLLRQMVERATGEAKPPRFAYGEYGKPFLMDSPQLHFNMSHCRRAVMCVVGGAPVGCDVEEIVQNPDTDVLGLCFSPRERAAIMAAASPGVEFAKQWTRKEALLKMRGLGLVDDMASLMRSPLAEGVTLHTGVSTDGSYAYTVCGGAEEECDVTLMPPEKFR